MDLNFYPPGLHIKVLFQKKKKANKKEKQNKAH